jgi:hypothetical protein
MTRIVQIKRDKERRVALVDEPHLRLLEGFDSVVGLAQEAASSGTALADLAVRRATGAQLDYDPIHAGDSQWKLLTPVDHPEPARCLVSGTGLTHLGSATSRNAMHAASDSETDSMKMFRWGVERGRPAAGSAGVAPEWFYKGCGTILRAHGEALEWPAHAEDGGEEGEIAGVYWIAADGNPRRLGMAVGNEFSDHVFEKRNYLNLAGSKLRTCSLGPELVLDPIFESVPGTVTIERAGRNVWSQPVVSGETEMCHSLANIEHHHFKFATHRRPGDVHVHYYGACALSFGAGIRLEDGDVMQIAFDGFGRALRNPLRVESGPMTIATALPL